MEDFWKNHPFPDLTGFLPSEEDEAKAEVSDWVRAVPIDTSPIFPPVDLNEIFENVVEKQIDSSQMFNCSFDFDENTGHIRNVDVQLNACAGAKNFKQSKQDLFTVDKTFVQDKLSFLDSLESFEEFESQIDDLPLPTGDLKSFVLQDLPIKKEDLADNETLDAATSNAAKIAGNTSQKTQLHGFTVTQKEIKREFEFAKLLKPTETYEPKEKIIKYPFKLDFFQRAAIVCLENREHVFVAAHTSAGKTVVAEWAIMLAVSNLRKAIYTSPIKALSNQKFNDFKKTFVGRPEYPGFSVGILTGDVQINGDASCLIMTTEILRSMLYLNSSVISEVDYVIFDEVHYISDEERGVVWEETLIMLPPSVTIVMLSATVGNAMQFANWLGGIKKRLVNVVFTAERPVPLTHYLYTGFKLKNKKEVELVPFMDAASKVAEINVRAADASVKANRDSGLSKFSKLFVLLNKLKRDNLLPVIVFVFSKKQIDEMACKMKGDYVADKHEAWHIQTFIKSKLKTVKADYVEQSRQVHQFEPLLIRGIGVHHSGVLPILKEIVELLFAKGFVKVLLATETFAMGVNMPAKSVVFSSVQKYGNLDDGVKLGRRLLKPSEFIQMAGRAGRRGQDHTGTVIIFCDSHVPDSQDLRSLTTTKLTSLRSHFHVTYSMILKIFRSESQLNIEDMMGRSFSEIRRIFVHEKSVAEAQDLEKALEAEGDYKSEAVAICKHCSNEKLNNYVINSKNYFNLCAEALDNYKFTIFSNYLKVGRLVVMNFSSMQNTLGVLLEVQKDRSLEILTSVDGKCGYEEITVAAKSDSCDRLPLYDEFPNFFGQDFTPCLVKCRYSQLLQITKYSVDLTQSAAQSVIDSFEKRAKYQRIPFPFSKAVFETLTLVSDCLKTAKSNNETISIDVLALFTNKNKTLKQHELYEQVLSSLHLLERNGRTTQCGLFLEHAKLFNQKLEKRRELEKLRESMSDETLQNYDHYQERREILRKSKYLDQHGKLTLKGKVACQISVQEILITEAVFANLFENLTAPEIAAFLSIFVYQGPSSEELDIKKFVENITVKKAIYRMLHLRAEFMANVAIKSFGIPSYGDICVNLVDTVFLFASQASYEEIIKSVDRMEELGAKPVLEGDIVRCLQRVEYLVRELLAMAFIIGDQNLAARFGEVRQAFKSELVFVNSLYLQS